MKPSRLLLAGLALLAVPAASATHNVCHSEGSESGLGGVDVALQRGGFVCLGVLGLGVDEDVRAGPTYGASVRVISCSGQSCSDVVGSTGVMLVPDNDSPVCANGSCYEVVPCLLDSTCP
jgi:hypothetical protein